MTEQEFEVTLVPIDVLTPDPNNARGHEKGIPELAQSLREFGQQKPLVVWGDNVVIAGNGLLEAAKSIDMTFIFIKRTPTDWSYEKARAYALADNRTAELSTWKMPEVTKQLFALKEFQWDMSSLGFENFGQPRRVSFDVSPQLTETGYAIIIDCDNEEQQRVLLERFRKQKLSARPLMT